MTEATQQLTLSSRKRRIAAFLIDHTILTFLMVIIIFLGMGSDFIDNSDMGKMKKVMSQNSFHLKGSGWYVTDYASGHNGSAPSKEKLDESSASKKGDEVTKDKPKKEASSSNDKKEKTE